MNLEKKVEELAERLENLKEENRELRRQNKKLSRRIDGLMKDKDVGKGSKTEDISRRSFMKKLGAGAVGLGALGLSPVASSLKITENGVYGGQGLGLFDSGSKYFEISDGGPVKIKNSELQISDTLRVSDQFIINAGSGFTNIRDYKGNLTLEAAGDGSHQISLRDRNANVDKLLVREGGPVELKNSSFQMNQNNIKNAGKIGSKRIRSSNDSLVRAEPSSNVSMSSQSWTAMAYGNVTKDERGEYDGSIINSPQMKQAGILCLQQDL